MCAYTKDAQKVSSGIFVLALKVTLHAANERGGIFELKNSDVDF